MAEIKEFFKIELNDTVYEIPRLGSNPSDEKSYGLLSTDEYTQFKLNSNLAGDLLTFKKAIPLFILLEGEQTGEPYKRLHDVLFDMCTNNKFYPISVRLEGNKYMVVTSYNVDEFEMAGEAMLYCEDENGCKYEISLLYDSENFQKCTVSITKKNKYNVQYIPETKTLKFI